MDKKIIALSLVFVIILVSAVAVINNAKKSSDNQQDYSEKIYNLDPQRKLIGTQLEDVHFKDVITGNLYHFDDLKGKPIIIETFYVGCPACAAGIKNYNQLYDKYGDKIQIIYININKFDSEKDILDMKAKNDGRNWIWTKYGPTLLPFYENLNIYAAEQTFIMDKNGKVTYADSFGGIPISRIENELIKLV